MSEARWWLGSLAVIKLEAADTDGRVSIVEITEPPGAEAPLTPGGFEGAITELSTPARNRELPPLSEAPPDMAGIEDRIAQYGCEMVAANG